MRLFIVKVNSCINSKDRLILLSKKLGKNISRSLSAFTFVLLLGQFAFSENYYETLKVSSDSSLDTIKSAYKKLAMELHPDRNPIKDAEEQFKKIKQAYDVLKDPQKRHSYDAHMSSSQTFVDPNHVLTSFENVQNLSTKEILTLLANFEKVVWMFIKFSHMSTYENMTASDKELLKGYSRAFKNLSLAPQAQKLEVINSLIRLENTIQCAFGMDMGLNYYEGAFPIDTISSAVSSLIMKISFKDQQEVIHFINELASFAEKKITVLVSYGDTNDNLVLWPLEISMRWNHLFLTKSLYQLAVTYNLIVDAKSLINFTEQYANRILYSDRESSFQSFLRSNKALTFSFLKQSTAQETIVIIREMYGVNQAIALEEWFRVGSRKNIKAKDYLDLLKVARGFGDHWSNNRFGKIESRDAENIFQRIHRVSAALTREFSQSGPTKDEINEFKKLSNFKLGEYMYFKLFPFQLELRDYEVQTRNPLSTNRLTVNDRNVINTEKRILPNLIKCIHYFKN